MTHHLNYTGCYHPDSPQIFTNILEYRNWYTKTRSKTPDAKPAIMSGSFFHAARFSKTIFAALTL